MSDEHFTPPRWMVPRERSTFGVRLAQYCALGILFVVVAGFAGLAIEEASCDSTQHECDLAGVAGMVWAFFALVGWVTLAVLNEVRIWLRYRP